MSTPDHPAPVQMQHQIVHRPMLSALRIGGFTLIEMAFVIVIASTLLLIGVKTISAMAVGAANRATTERLTTVRDALQAHVNRFGRLPCPDLGVAPDVVGFDGLESGTCSGLDNWGVLPYITLSITRADAQDGWGRMFLYQVSDNWAAAGSTIVGTPTVDTPIGAAAPPLGDITVLEKRADGTQVGTVTGVVAVVVSAGLNGFGAFGDKAVSRNDARTVPTGTDELDNTRLGTDPNITRYVSRAVTDSTAAATGAFDDLILYFTGPAMAAKATESVAFKSETAKLERCLREAKANACDMALTPSCSVAVFSGSMTATGVVGANPRLYIRPGTSTVAGTYSFSLPQMTGCI